MSVHLYYLLIYDLGNVKKLRGNHIKIIIKSKRIISKSITNKLEDSKEDKIIII